MIGLKLALVGPLSPPSGGMANQTRQLAGLLSAEPGLSVEVIRVNAPYRPAWIERVWGVRALARLFPYAAALWRAAGEADLFHIMANSGWSWHLYAAPAIWIAKMRGAAVVVNYRGGEAAAFFSRSMKIVRPSLARTDAIVVPSGFLEAVFVNWGYTPHIVPNIINLERFTYRPETFAHQGPRLLVARNLEPIYDNATPIRALRLVRMKFPDAHLTIAGTGPERGALEKLVNELGLHGAVTFAGRVDNERMAALYGDHDIAINPSLVDNMPISVLEALASGLPVVSTDVGGVPYIVEHERSALLVPPRTPAAMAEAVMRLADDPALAERLRVTGKEAVAQYAWSNVRERLLQVYRDVLSRGARGQSVAECK